MAGWPVPDLTHAPTSRLHSARRLVLNNHRLDPHPPPPLPTTEFVVICECMYECKFSDGSLVIVAVTCVCCLRPRPPSQPRMARAHLRRCEEHFRDSSQRRKPARCGPGRLNGRHRSRPRGPPRCATIQAAAQHGGGVAAFPNAEAYSRPRHSLHPLSTRPVASPTEELNRGGAAAGRSPARTAAHTAPPHRLGSAKIISTVRRHIQPGDAKHICSYHNQGGSN